MSKALPFPGKSTKPAIIKDLAESVEALDTLLICGLNKDGEFYYNWSMQTQSDLAYTLLQLTKAIHEAIE